MGALCRVSELRLNGLSSAGQSVVAMEMLSSAALSYCQLGKNEGAACRSLLTLCKWLLADWKDMTPQLKQASFAPPSIRILPDAV